MKFILFVALIWSILDSGWSITDEEYIQFKAALTQIQVLMKKVEVLENENQELKMMNQEFRQFKSEATKKFVELEKYYDFAQEDDNDLVQNATIEERVAFLEVQMAEVQEDLVTVDEDLDFLFEEQVIQDERIYDLEQETTDLDTRVEVLEANGGGGGNVTALEVRVETLEGTTAQHETHIADLANVTSNLDGQVETLEGDTSELETRLTTAETQVEDLQEADAELDARITDLEEGGGGSETIAFRAVMEEDVVDITPGTTVVFNDVQLNEGNGYDPETGVFTVPSGGAGYYYFSTYFTMYSLECAYIDLRVNDVALCTVLDDTQDANDWDNAGCSLAVSLEEGDEVRNFYSSGTDSSPFVGNAYSGFTGFRI